MDKLKSKLKFLYQYIISSIGFYPTLISFLFFLLAVFMLYLERHGLSQKFLDSMVAFMIITNGDTAGLILSSITTGIISLTVFSFTMVMLVLNQASTNFSPRVIPGLISHKSNQSVMGLFLGTLIYTLIIMTNIRSESYSESLPGFAIFLSMCFAIICLGFFVFFIHAISQSIQIGNILQDIYFMTLKRLNYEIEYDNKLKAPNIFENQESWTDLNSPETGYLQSFDKDALIKICKEYDIVLDFNSPLGNFIVKGIPFGCVNKQFEKDGELEEKLMHHFNFNREERPDLNYLMGFKHIVESGVKALSPGINDPGTAVKSIEYLTALFARRMHLTDEKIICDEDGAARIRFKNESFEALFKTSISPIRLYGKANPLIMAKLLLMLKSLLYKAKDFSHLCPILRNEAELIISDADHEIVNVGDRDIVNEVTVQINKLNILAEPLPYLSPKP